MCMIEGGDIEKGSIRYVESEFGLFYKKEYKKVERKLLMKLGKCFLFFWIEMRGLYYLLCRCCYFVFCGFVVFECLF